MLEFVVDDGFQVAIRLGAVNHAAVDEDSRRALNADAMSLVNIFLYCGSLFPGIETGVELGRVQLQIRSPPFQGIDGQFSLISEQRIVEFPEMMLIVRAKG